MANYPTSDKNYDLVSTMYHALQGVENAQTYENDAKESGDKEAAEFFHGLADEYRSIAEKAKPLLKNRI